MGKCSALFLLVSLQGLAGCADPWTYHKTATSEAEFKRDAEECRQNATAGPFPKPFVLSEGRIQSYPYMKFDRQVYNRCMEGRGYTVGVER